MRRLTAAVLALALAGCAMPEAEVVIAEPLMEEPAIEASPVPKAKVEACIPGEDDGIGGTGCSVD